MTTQTNDAGEQQPQKDLLRMLAEGAVHLRNALDNLLRETQDAPPAVTRLVAQGVVDCAIAVNTLIENVAVVKAQHTAQASPLDLFKPGQN